MWTAKSFQNDDHIILSAYLLIPTFLLVFALWAQHVVARSKQNVVTPMSLVLIIGMTVSAIANVCGAYDVDQSQFQFANIELSSSVFYFALLPPIIHSSAYSVRRKDLLRNWDAVCLLAFAGSIISILVMTMVFRVIIQVFLPDIEVSTIELLTFSSLISSVDPVSALAVFSKLRVDPNLYYLLLSESLFNDAVCVVAYRVLSKYIGTSINMQEIAMVVLREFTLTLLLSLLLGYLCGLAIALFLKDCGHFPGRRHDRLVTICILICHVYLPFLLAEAVELSGIVAVVASSISTRRYASKNLVGATKQMASFTFSTMSHASETATFLLLGMSVFSQYIASYNLGFILAAIVAMVFARAVFVYPLVALVNLRRQWTSPGGLHISLNITHMVVISGCLRGAVSFSCANIYPNSCGNHGLILSTTTALVLVTTFGVGGSVEWLLGRAGIAMKCQQRTAQDNRGIGKVPDREGRCLYPLLLRQPLVPITPHAEVSAEMGQDDESEVYSLSHATPHESDSEGEWEGDEASDEGFHTPQQCRESGQV